MKFLKVICLVFFALNIGVTTYGQEDPFETHKKEIFLFKGKQARVVFPNGKPNGEWIWRARFWGAEPQTDLALLEKGFHLVYIDVAHLFGNNEAVSLWNGFYEYCIKKYQLKTKVVLEGFSRGGLIVYNWAAENTNKVACIYADAPVCDIKSWPGGLYKGTGSKADWETCLKAHGLDKQTVLDYEGIPLFTATKVAQAKIPVLHVCGGSDLVVPFEENSKKLTSIFQKHGGAMEVILKEGIGHHPHSLKDPTPIVDFILSHTVLK